MLSRSLRMILRVCSLNTASRYAISLQLVPKQLVPGYRSLSTSNGDHNDTNFTEFAFHKVADDTLLEIESAVSHLDEIVDGFDISNAMGVLTIRLGEQGTYVINKQTPNRQLWWSSPISGPRRYNWDESTKRWLNTRDHSDIKDNFAKEIKELTEETIEFH